MDAIQCLISRRSIREYTDEPISAQEIENVVEIAQMASCWENTQPIRYVAVLDKELKIRLPMIARRNFRGIQKIFMPHRHWWCSAPSKVFPASSPTARHRPRKELTGSPLMPV